MAENKENEFDPDQMIIKSEEPGTDPPKTEQISDPAEPKPPEPVKKQRNLEKKWDTRCARIDDMSHPQCSGNFSTEEGCPVECTSFKQREVETSNVEQATLLTVLGLLDNEEFVFKNSMSIDTSRKWKIIIQDLMKNEGKLITGVGTLDGLTMYPCPKHGYAPVTGCILKCKFFHGSDNSGICTCKDTNIVGFPRYSHLEAKQLEIKMRRENTAQIIQKKKEEEEKAKMEMEKDTFGSD